MTTLVYDAGVLGFQALAPRTAVCREYSGRTIPDATLADADAVFVRSTTHIDAAQLPESVRFIGTATIGLDHLPLHALAARGIEVASAPGCNAWAVTDYVLSTIAHWADTRGRNRDQLTLGVVGVGHVGGLLVKRAEALGLRCLLSDAPKARKGLCPRHQSLESVLSAVDVLSVHVPKITEGVDCTTALLDVRALQRLTPGSLVINASRGSVIPESAILTSGELDWALDVFPAEPIVSNALLSRVWQATPHIAGHSVDGKFNGTRAVLRAWSALSGQPLQSLDVRTYLDTIAQPTTPDTTDVWSDVRAHCPLESVDHALRQAVMHRTDPARAFDTCRRRYVLRRESSQSLD
jgi:erythronate-4-phosphate dehydrogenase